MKETLRWRPNMTASGVPRALVQDDSFGDYRFEKGTVFTWNHYGISHDEDEYPDNQTFQPERFLDDEVFDMLKGQTGFGFGRSSALSLSHSLACILISGWQAAVSAPDGSSGHATCSSPSADFSIVSTSSKTRPTPSTIAASTPRLTRRRPLRFAWSLAVPNTNNSSDASVPLRDQKLTDIDLPSQKLLDRRGRLEGDAK
jgi:hypothetical protein